MKSNSPNVSPIGLYILTIGLGLGILLGPFVLGRFSPELYEKMFPAGQAAEALAIAEEEAEQKIIRAKTFQEESDVTPDYINIIIDDINAELADLREALHSARANIQAPRRTALLLAILVIMGLESALTAPGSAARRRLTIARYALAAVLLGLLLAVPWPLNAMSMVFFGLLLLIALAAAFIPMGKRSSN